MSGEGPKALLFGPISPFQVWYYALPLGLMLFAMAFRAAVLRFRRRITWSQPQLVLLGVGTLCALLYIVAPDTFSGGSGFDQRFPIFAVLFVLCAIGSNAAFERDRYRVQSSSL
jgi:peptidoglycan/LPS O-acetylase OafA/YrhL